MAVVSFGANDVQGVCDGGHCGQLMTPYWQQVIGRRMESYVAMLRRHGATVYWVGLPAMRDADFDSDTASMDAFFAATMRRLGVPFIEIRPMTVDADGRYEAYYQDADGASKLLRAGDGIHMSMNGYIRITKGLAGRIRATVEAARKDAAPSTDQAGTARRDSPRRGGGAVHGRMRGHFVPGPRARPVPGQASASGAEARGPAGPHPPDRRQPHGGAMPLRARGGICFSRATDRAGVGCCRPAAPMTATPPTASPSPCHPTGRWRPISAPAGAACRPRSGWPRSTSPARARGRPSACRRTRTSCSTAFTVCALTRANAGRLALRAGTQTVTFDLAAPSERPECRTMRLDQPAASADVTASGGPVTITSWATFRDAGGIALSNLGVVGSQLIHFARTDDTVLAEELHAYQPDLIVLAFGTNEGFSPRFSSFEYEITLRTQIGRLRRLAGNVPILLLGAPDALSRRAEMRGNAPGQPLETCPEFGAPAAVTPAPATPAPDTAAATPDAGPGMIAGIMDRLRSSLGMAPPDQAQPAPPPPAAPSSARAPLFPPPALRGVRDVQRRVAASLNVAFWDWEARMGGRCTANRWVHASPPLMRGDYVHYTSAGGHELAQRLQADLDKATAR